MSVLEHIDAVGNAQRRLRVLFDHQDRGAALLDPLDRIEDLDLQACAIPTEGSTSNSNEGLPIRARPVATICC